MSQTEKRGVLIAGVILFGVIFLAAFAIVEAFIFPGHSSSNYRFPHPERTIQDTNNLLELQWQLSDVVSYGDSHVVGAGGVVYFSGLKLAPRFYDINGLNVDNGTITQSFDFAYSDSIASLGIQNNKLFVGFDKTTRIGSEDQVRGAARIEAYDLSTQEQLWKQRIPGTTNIPRIYLSEDILATNARWSTWSNNYYLSTESGEILSKESNIDNNFRLYQDKDFRFEQDWPFFQWIDTETNQVLWRKKFGDYIYPPFIIDNELLIRTGGSVYILEKTTGEIIGYFEDVISNLAASQEHAFFITSDASLFVVDIKTGKLLGEVLFGPEIAYEYYPTSYLVAANEDWLVVHFGDSQQLFGFKVLQNRQNQPATE